MATGTVKFFNDSKGFGFIKSESGEEIFVHVEYEVQNGKKGLNAVNVKLA
jgi:CspA family cold shock protein